MAAAAASHRLFRIVESIHSANFRTINALLEVITEHNVTPDEAEQLGAVADDILALNGEMSALLLANTAALRAAMKRDATDEPSAKTSFGGLSVQSNATSTSPFPNPGTVEAVAQGGSGQTSFDDQAFGAISTALPDNAYATTLIGDASNVAAPFLGPGNEIFGTTIIPVADETSSTFDFSYRGDLIADGGFDIIINGVDLGADLESDFTGDNSVINLGSNFGPNIDLTIYGNGVLVFGGAVPEPSTWAMLLLGFAGLGYAGYRRARAPRAV
jgi:hypothetical protein